MPAACIECEVGKFIVMNIAQVILNYKKSGINLKVAKRQLPQYHCLTVNKLISRYPNSN